MEIRRKKREEEGKRGMWFLSFLPAQHSAGMGSATLSPTLVEVDFSEVSFRAFGGMRVWPRNGAGNAKGSQ